MKFRDFHLEIMKILANPKIPLDTEIWFEGENKNSVRVVELSYESRRKRVMVKRKRQGNQHSRRVDGEGKEVQEADAEEGVTDQEQAEPGGEDQKARG